MLVALKKVPLSSPKYPAAVKRQTGKLWLCTILYFKQTLRDYNLL